MEELTFEAAEKELEEIISKMENGNIPFSKTQELYERGSQLIKFCLSSLEQAKGKISIIKKDLDTFIEEKFE